MRSLTENAFPKSLNTKPNAPIVDDEIKIEPFSTRQEEQRQRRRRRRRQTTTNDTQATGWAFTFVSFSVCNVGDEPPPPTGSVFGSHTLHVPACMHWYATLRNNAVFPSPPKICSIHLSINSCCECWLLAGPAREGGRAACGVSVASRTRKAEGAKHPQLFESSKPCNRAIHSLRAFLSCAHFVSAVAVSGQFLSNTR